MNLLLMFKPPEWSLWNPAERTVYCVSLVAFLLLVSLGGRTLYGWLMGVLG